MFLEINTKTCFPTQNLLLSGSELLKLGFQMHKNIHLELLAKKFVKIGLSFEAGQPSK